MYGQARWTSPVAPASASPRAAATRRWRGAGQVEEVELLDVAGQAPQLARPAREQRAPEARLRLDQLVERVAAEDERLGGLDRDDGRRVRRAVEQRELAEEARPRRGAMIAASLPVGDGRTTLTEPLPTMNSASPGSPWWKTSRRAGSGGRARLSQAGDRGPRRDPPRTGRRRERTGRGPRRHGVGRARTPNLLGGRILHSTGLRSRTPPAHATGRVRDGRTRAGAVSRGAERAGGLTRGPAPPGPAHRGVPEARLSADLGRAARFDGGLRADRSCRRHLVFQLTARRSSWG